MECSNIKSSILILKRKRDVGEKAKTAFKQHLLQLYEIYIIFN